MNVIVGIDHQTFRIRQFAKSFTQRIRCYSEASMYINLYLCDIVRRRSRKRCSTRKKREDFEMSARLSRSAEAIKFIYRPWTVEEFKVRSVVAIAEKSRMF